MSEFAGNPMGQQESIFVAASGGRFFRPKDTEYRETSLIVKIVWLIIAVLALLGTVVFFILRACSFGTMLNSADLDKHTIEYVVEQDVNAYGNTFTVFCAETETDGKLALILAERSKLGFWHIEEQDIAQTTDDTAMITWGDDTNDRYFTWPQGVKMEWEKHYVYAGQDAVKELEIREEQLPDNAAISITQRENKYLIHMIRFYIVDDSADFSFNFEEALRENGCIQ